MATKRTAPRSPRRQSRKAPRAKTHARPVRRARAARSAGAAPRRPESALGGARGKKLRADLLHLLAGRGAHVAFDRAVAEMPPELQGQKPAGAPYTPWQQLEHLRVCQRDILDYVRDPKYVERNWPDDYWPAEAPPAPAAWGDAVRAFEADRRAFIEIVSDPKTDLLARVPYDPKGPTILHEVLLAADHNAYHLGQLIVLRRALGAWRD